jgi:hypothetical protein
VWSKRHPHKAALIGGDKTMAHKFSELEEKTSPESRARVDQAVREAALKELPLDELQEGYGPMWRPR